MLEVRIPRLNANEDEVFVVEIFVAPGDRVSLGDLLLAVESSKVTKEIEAEIEGFVADVLVTIGSTTPVGAVALRLAEQPSDGEAAVPTGDADASGKARPRTTAKQRLMAKGKRRARASETAAPDRVPQADAAPQAVPPDSLSWVCDARSSRVRLPDGITHVTPDVAAELGFDIDMAPGSSIETKELYVGSQVRIGAGCRIRADSVFLGDGVLVAGGCTIDTGELILHDGTTMWENVRVDLGGGKSRCSCLLVGPASHIGMGSYLNTCRELVMESESAVGPGTMMFTHSFWQSVLDGYSASHEAIRICRDAWVGASCQVQPGVIVGAGAIVMSNSTVINHVPVETLVAGVPASVMKTGLRKELSQEERFRTLNKLLEEFAHHLGERGCRLEVEENGARLHGRTPQGEEFHVLLVTSAEAMTPRRGEILVVLEGSGVEPGEGAVLSLRERTFAGTETPAAHELRNFLRRYGILFAPFGWRPDFTSGIRLD